MNFPEIDRVIYDKNPLQEVVFQITFPVQFSLVSSVPADFQLALGLDYPNANIRDELTFRVGQLSKNDEPVTQPKRLFDFSTQNEMVRITLCSDYLAVHIVDYFQWELFEQHISKALSALTQCYLVPQFTRIGLRYINKIDKDTISLDLAWSDLIRKSALGLMVEDDIPLSELKEHSSYSVFDVPSGSLALRHGLVLNESRTGQHYLIDIDVFNDTGQMTDADVIDNARGFNAVARNAFRWLISDETHEALVPRPAK